MSLRDIMKRGWYRQIDEKPGGEGDDLPLDDATVDDDKTDDTTDDKTEDTSDVSDSTDDDKTDDKVEDKPDAKLTELEQENQRLERELEALRKPAEEKPAAEAETRLTPYQQAKKELEAEGLDPELWPEKVHERADAIREERYENDRLAADRPRFVQMHQEMFTKEGEPPEVASQMAADMTAIRLAYGKSAFEDTPLGKDQTRDSLVYAHGLQRLREIAARKKSAKPGEKPPLDIDDEGNKDADGFKAPVNNGGASNGNVYSKIKSNPANKSYLDDFKAEFGRDPTNKELEKMKKDNLVVI